MSQPSRIEILVLDPSTDVQQIAGTAWLAGDLAACDVQMIETLSRSGITGEHGELPTFPKGEKVMVPMTQGRAWLAAAVENFRGVGMYARVVAREP